MNLTEIKHAVEKIVALNPGITKERLTTLLVASGWEMGSIQEALVLYETITPDLPAPHVIAEDYRISEHTTTLPKDDIVSLSEPEVISTIAEEVYTAPTVEPIEVVHVEQQVTEPIQEEPQSRIPETLQEETPSSKKEAPEIPDELPLRPFEGSPHVWSFSKYKALFSGDVAPELEVQIVPPPLPQVMEPVTVHREEVVHQHVHVTVPVVFKPEPLSQKDKQLVITASVLLLVILLMLWYMYSQGRI
ncbi:MAG: hypothetical protein KBC50_03245 [Candidatus Pacebacteria bacterium]|nr:hypothetical protein [Candidatus Paceibacterota bacterium]